jgi:exodeoxyribonuclease VII large subunit
MHSSASASRNILTVTKLNRLSRSILESEIGQVWLTAEISNFVSASSGHWYFTLKDDRAQVRGAMFRGANRRVIQKPKEGDKVLVKANIGIYEARAGS